MTGLPPGLRDELDRLRWVERQVTILAARWFEEAALIRAAAPDGRLALDLAARAAELEGCAAALAQELDSSRVDGGPPVDWVAEAQRYLERALSGPGDAKVTIDLTYLPPRPPVTPAAAAALAWRGRT